MPSSWPRWRAGCDRGSHVLGLAGTDWVVFGSLAALAGCLALDETAAAQTWLSQPLPAALLAGAVAGDPALGLAVGLPLQLALTMNLPVGQTITGDVSGAAVAVVGAAAVGGSRPGWPIARTTPRSRDGSCWVRRC